MFHSGWHSCSLDLLHICHSLTCALLLLLALPHMCSLTRNCQVPFANLFRPGTFYLLGQGSSSLIKKVKKTNPAESETVKLVHESNWPAEIYMNDDPTHCHQPAPLCCDASWCLLHTWRKISMSHRQSKGNKTSALGMRDENSLLFLSGAAVLFVTSGVPWKSKSWACTGCWSGGNPDFSWFFSVLLPAVVTVLEESRR